MGILSITPDDATYSSDADSRSPYLGSDDSLTRQKVIASESAGNVGVIVLEGLPILREAMVAWLNQQTGVRVEANSSDHATTLAQIIRFPTAIVLMDLMVGARDGLEFIREIRATRPTTKILVFSAQDEKIYVERVLKAGASGYVMKGAPSVDLLAALKLVSAGELAISRHMELLLLRRLAQPRNVQSAYGAGSLTDRELHVFQLIGAGLAPRNIAERLKLSVKTIETHRENIKNKLNLHSSSEVIRVATLWITEQSR